MHSALCEPRLRRRTPCAVEPHPDRHRAIAYDGAPMIFSYFADLTIPVGVRCDHMPDAAELAAGVGVALLLDDYASCRHPNLRPVGGSAVTVEIWLVHRKAMGGVPRVRAVLDWLAGVFRTP